MQSTVMDYNQPVGKVIDAALPASTAVSRSRCLLQQEALRQRMACQIVYTQAVRCAHVRIARWSQSDKLRKSCMKRMLSSVYNLLSELFSGLSSQQAKTSPIPALARPALAPTSAHNAPPKQAAARALEDIYRKMTPLEHILARPDTYIGSVEKQDKSLWVHTGEGMADRKIDFAPGLYKIFDEASYRNPPPCGTPPHE